MANTKQIKRRIIGVKKTQQITNAMKMVATVKFKKAYDAMSAAEPYLKNIKEILDELLLGSNISFSHFLFEKRNIKKRLIIIISADKGLCGNFNSKLFDKALGILKNENNITSELILIGKKARDFFKKVNIPVVSIYPNIFTKSGWTMLKELNSKVIQLYQEKKYDEVYLLSNEFKNTMQSKITYNKLLPVEKSTENKISEKYYIYEPSLEVLIDALLPEYVNSKILSALLQSNTSEQGIRMSMMDLATENAEELISGLTLLFNKERQASITKEIAEISTASEALK